ncbi:phage terminase small subunit [Planomicrobium stackebrandtii]|uniref:Phage terminase small subunit n=1 Tax=Planomicrobium stackebrandtii TaxID=253160 RepID=A0ABU0GRK8_9BACL|nr:terminase small subunit [Planomicrobium stackebrandtii]MDQ0427688.1 phage terminase small subunit [Planomicrobium stackebrandtii]
MARKRDPRRDEAFEIWKKHKGDIKLKDIAERLGVLDTQIRKWKSQDKWEPSKGNVTNSKRNVTKPKEDKEVFVESEGLTDKQRLFCIYYIKSFNQTMAAIKAGYSPDRAHVTGSELVRNRKVGEEIRRLKGEMRQGIFIDAMDILEKYIKIAFSDITDYVQFGTRESPAVNIVTGEPLLDGNGDQIMQPYTYLDLGESAIVDGSLLTEVKQGRDGISVKLADKMKALEMLSKYFDLLSEDDKKQLQKEKLKVDIAKSNAEIEKINGDDDGGPIEIMISRKGGR